MRVAIPDDVAQERADDVDAALLRANDHRATRRIGDDWYDRGDTAVLWVPSVVSPYEFSVLCNQLHVDFSRIVVGEPTPSSGRCPPAVP